MAAESDRPTGVYIEHWRKTTFLDDVTVITSTVELTGHGETMALSRDLAYRLLTEAGYVLDTETTETSEAPNA